MDVFFSGTKKMDQKTPILESRRFTRLWVAWTLTSFWWNTLGASWTSQVWPECWRILPVIVGDCLIWVWVVLKNTNYNGDHRFSVHFGCSPNVSKGSSLNCQVTRGTFSRWSTDGQHGRWSWRLAFVKQLFFSGIRWPFWNHHQLHCLEILKIYTRLGTWPFSPKSLNKKISIGPGNHSSHEFCQASVLESNNISETAKETQAKIAFQWLCFCRPHPTFWNPAMADQSRWFIKEKPLEERIKASSGAG